MSEAIKSIVNLIKEKFVKGKIHTLGEMQKELNAEVDKLKAEINGEDEWMLKCKKKQRQMTCTGEKTENA